MGDNYYLLDDMEKYHKEFDRKLYEHLSAKELVSIFRVYYEKHLPVDVTTWIRVNSPDERLLYKDGLGSQVCLVRDTIMRNMFYSGEFNSGRYKEFQPKVISTHCSKSVLLPVMEIDLREYGIKITLRNNFYNWNLSVESDIDVVYDHKGTIDDGAFGYCFCEGFPANKRFGKYEENKKNFTVCITGDYQLYTFMYLLKDWLLTRTESHEIKTMAGFQ